MLAKAGAATKAEESPAMALGISIFIDMELALIIERAIPSVIAQATRMKVSEEEAVNIRPFLDDR